jgi:peptidoglycan/LPS O-acetylase OafA/YrhL
MKHRFEGLDIFRGLFSAMVVFFHMAAFANTPIINNNFVRNSDLFVDFFFVLSGFVITYTYQNMSTTNELRTFYQKRLKRLYPLHFIMLIVFVLLEVIKHNIPLNIKINQPANVNNNLTSFITSLLLLNSVKVPGVNDVSWNIPSWSISAEMISYVVFGCMIFFVNKQNFSKAKNFLFITIAVLSFAVMSIITGTFQINYSYDYGFLRGFTGFFAGAFCLNLFFTIRTRFIEQPAYIFHFAECVCIALIFYFIFQGDTYKKTGYIYEFIFMLSVIVFAFEKGFVSTLLKKSSFLLNMGKYSYSIYMIHAFLLSMFNIVFVRILKFTPESYSWLFIINYLLIYFAAQWSYKNIEMRFTSNKKKQKNTTT